jgi:copper transport protein
MPTVRRLLVVVGLLLAVLAAAQSPAAAHARLVSSSPVEGAVTAAAPAQVVLRFDEKVDAALSSLELAAPGESIRALDVRTGRASMSLHAALPAGAAGLQVVLWRAVTTDDGHAEQGRLTFTIAVGPAAAVAGPQQPAAASVDVPSGAVSGAVYGTARWLALLGFCVLVGTAFFMAVCVGNRAPSRGRGLARRTGWGLLAASTTIALATYGAAVSGRPLRDALDGAVLDAGFTSRVGVALGLRLLLVLIAVEVAVVGRRTGPLLVSTWAVFTAATWSMTGHSRRGGAALFMVPLDVMHLVAAAVWLGGLVALLASGRGLESAAVRRFSTVALFCVAVLVTTGVVQAWCRVGSTAALTDNGYGQLLLLKLGLVVATLAAATAVRHRLRRDGVDLASRLRRGVLIEAALGVTVLGVTSALVVTQPARDEHAQILAAREASSIQPLARVEPVTATAPFDTRRPGGRGQLAIEVLPQVGKTTVHLAVLTTDQQPLDARVVVALRRTGSSGSGLPVRMQRLGLGHFVSSGAVVTTAGDWELGVGVLLPDGGQAVTTAAFTVR